MNPSFCIMMFVNRRAHATLVNECNEFEASIVVRVDKHSTFGPAQHCLQRRDDRRVGICLGRLPTWQFDTRLHLLIHLYLQV